MRRARGVWAGVCGVLLTTAALGQSPVQVPLQAPARLPDPRSSVSGGGPLSADAQAVARIELQLPAIPQDLQLTGLQALEYAGRLASAFPGLAPAFNGLNQVARCAIQHGVIGAKAYITPELTAAGVMVVLSRGQLQQLPQIALRCFFSGVMGGGLTEGGFSPCIRQYFYDAAINGVADRYFVVVGGTNTASCDLLESFHRRFNPTPFTG